MPRFQMYYWYWHIIMYFICLIKYILIQVYQSPFSDLIKEKLYFFPYSRSIIVI